MLYLLHSTVRLGTTGRNSATHYLGHCEPDELEYRVKRHKAGTSGAKIIAAYVNAGATLHLTGVWYTGGRDDERRLKKLGHLDRYCAYCVAHERGSHWSPLTVRVNQLPPVYPLRGKKRPKEDTGLPSNSTLGTMPGVAPASQTREGTAPSTSETPRYHPLLGGNVSAAIAPPPQRT